MEEEREGGRDDRKIRGSKGMREGEKVGEKEEDGREGRRVGEKEEDGRVEERMVKDRH